MKCFMGLRRRSCVKIVLNFIRIFAEYMKHKPEIIAFINDHSYLFWYTPEQKKEEISEELLLETILNYGTLKESLTLFKLLGYVKALRILQSAKGRKKLNYYPEIHHFFSLSFQYLICFGGALGNQQLQPAPLIE